MSFYDIIGAIQFILDHRLKQRILLKNHIKMRIFPTFYLT